MSIKFENVAKFYIGCKAIVATSKYPESIIGLKHDKVLVGGRTIDVCLFDPEDVKPVLRKLKDMSEDEAQTILTWSGLLSYTTDVSSSFEPETTPIDFVMGIPEGFLFLINAGFDLFGLIETNQAVQA